jgi:hypothetical protein
LLESQKSCFFLLPKYTDNERNVIDDAVHANIERGEKNTAVYDLFSLKLPAVVIEI